MIPGVEQLTIVSSAGPQDADIAYELSHPDDEALEEAVARLAAQVQAIEGVEELDDGFDLGKRELNFELTPAGEAAGLRPADIARQVRQSFFGEEVQRFQRGREEVKVFVRYPERQRDNLSRLGQFRVRTADGGEIPLSVAASVTGEEKQPRRTSAPSSSGRTPSFFSRTMLFCATSRASARCSAQPTTSGSYSSGLRPWPNRICWRRIRIAASSMRAAGTSPSSTRRFRSRWKKRRALRPLHQR